MGEVWKRGVWEVGDPVEVEREREMREGFSRALNFLHSFVRPFWLRKFARQR